MEKKRAAGIIIYERQGKSFLMGLRADGQGWGFAAGKRERSDSSPMEAALRELREELGVVLSAPLRQQVRFHKTILCKYIRIDKQSHAVSRRTILSDIFYLEVDDKDAINFRTELMDGEVTAIRWLTLSELSSDINIFMPSLIALNTLELDFSLLEASTQA